MPFPFSYGNFNKGFHFLFDFNHSKITAPVVIAALGHAFFTLALGAGAMAMYGAYVPRDVNLGKTVLVVASLDVLVAILSGLAIFPIVFAYHLPPNAGPGLMYVTFPIILAHLSSGWFIGGLFFYCCYCPAWTSSINLAEPFVVILTQRLGLKRTYYAAIIIGLTAWYWLYPVLCFRLIAGRILNHGLTIFDISTNLLTPILFYR